MLHPLLRNTLAYLFKLLVVAHVISTSRWHSLFILLPHLLIVISSSLPCLPFDPRSLPSSQAWLFVLRRGRGRFRYLIFVYFLRLLLWDNIKIFLFTVVILAVICIIYSLYFCVPFKLPLSNSWLLFLFVVMDWKRLWRFELISFEIVDLTSCDEGYFRKLPLPFMEKCNLLFVLYLLIGFLIG